MAGFCFFDAPAGEHGSGHTGIEHGMTSRLEPLAQKCDVSRTSYAISTFDYDQLTAVVLLLVPGQRRAVKCVYLNYVGTAFSLVVRRSTFEFRAAAVQLSG